MTEYREVYVVSDLHLGGYTGRFDPSTGDWLPEHGEPALDSKDRRSFRIFRDASALAWAIREIAKAGPNVALVLNGDIVDFLALPDAVGFDPAGARQKLSHIIDDPELRPVWQALRDFLASGAGDLVLVIGNHDLELAMHDVCEYLIETLCGGQRELAERIVHCYDGMGFSCSVGDTNVLAVHGNAADPWNEVDYPLLLQIADARTRRGKAPGWRVNAGSKLVVEHMNKVKRRYQWVDLLKPETQAAAVITAALDQAHSAPIALLLENLLTRGPAMSRAVFVAAQPDMQSLSPSQSASSDPGSVDVDRELREAQERDAMGVRPGQLATDADAQGALAAREMVPSLLKLKLGGSLRGILRKHLPSDRSFDPQAPDEVFFELDKRTSPSIDFLIAGHTHLEKYIPRRRGIGYYFNSGTWTKLVQIPPSALASDDAFAPVLSVLKDGALASLERDVESAGLPPTSLVQTRRTVVKVEAMAGGASAALWHVTGQGYGAFAFEKVAASERRIVRPRSRS